MGTFLNLTLRDLPYPTLNKIAILIINSVAFYLMFMVVKTSRLKDDRSKIFVSMGIFMLLWVNCAYLARLFGLMPDIALFLLKVAWLATPLVFFCTYLMSMYLAKAGKENKAITGALLILSISLSVITATTDLIITGFHYTNSILDIIYGQGFYPFMVGIFILMIFTIVPLIRTKLDKKTKAFLLGVILFYIMNMIFNITLPVFFHITNLYFLGDYSTILLLGFTTYAIMRHELFDVKVLTTELFSVLILIVLGSKLLPEQTLEERIVNTLIFVSMVAFSILLVRSVLDEVQQRHELTLLTEKLQVLDARKDEFLSIVAHELRAPMTAIKGYISMLLEGDAGTLPDDAVEYLNVASKSNDRLIRLVNNMLNVSRIEEGRQVYQMGIVNLITVVKSIYDEFKINASSKGLKCVLELPSILPPDSVYVDKDRIHEVVSNFVSNSIKYTDTGTIMLKVYTPAPGYIRFEVSDTGKGIAPSDQQKLFQKYYRADSSVGRAVGTGLGLYISKLLIEKFGGKIGFSSQIGKGSTFWFDLPIVMPTEAKPNILV
jgi:signal transduction histidine kinase